MNWRDFVGSRAFRRLFTEEMMRDSLDKVGDERWRELVKLEMYLKTDLIRLGNCRLRKVMKCFLTRFYHEQ